MGKLEHLPFEFETAETMLHLLGPGVEGGTAWLDRAPLAAVGDVADDAKSVDKAFDDGGVPDPEAVHQRRHPAGVDLSRDPTNCGRH